MRTQYGFNRCDEFHMVAFIPRMEDREMLPVAVLNELGAPDGLTTHWTIGAVDVDVKTAGVVATLTHRVLASR